MKKFTRILALLAIVAVSLNSCKKEDSASCSDGIMNGTETGIDCGGDCNPCTVAPTCTDGIQNGDETGVDCGGDCDPCTVAPTCTDGIQNGNETGVDCGGDCDPCGVAPTCTDGIQNGNETGIDCGGSCPDACVTCSDGIQNGDETGVDCGGSCTPCVCGTHSVSDIDGNIYETVQIGSQCWIKQNLKTTRNNDGTLAGSQSPGQNPANEQIYGKLYTWHTLSPGKLCPDGWHIPSNAEWTQLVNHLGGTNVAGGALKSTSYWSSPNTGATNSSGFTALPAGYFSYSANYAQGLALYGYFWSSTQGPTSGKAYTFQTFYDDGGTYQPERDKRDGFSCRCIQD